MELDTVWNNFVDVGNNGVVNGVSDIGVFEPEIITFDQTPPFRNVDILDKTHPLDSESMLVDQTIPIENISILDRTPPIGDPMEIVWEIGEKIPSIVDRS